MASGMASSPNRMTIPGIPDRVIVILADDEGPYNDWTIFRLADERGYTHVHYLIRVGRYDRKGDYRVETWGRDGWHELTSGLAQGEWVEEGVVRAVSILFGMEDHG